jgi:hypothetical protein
VIQQRPAFRALRNPGEPKKTIDKSYIEAHTATVREQLVKAGVQLAGLLDRALGD